MNIIIFGFFLKIILVFSQLFFSLPGTEFDVVNFHTEAIRYSNHLNDNFLDFKNYNYKSGWYISNFLGIFYYFFGPSIYLGGTVSCFIWFFSALILRKNLINLKCSEKEITLAMLIYTFLLPISFLYTTFILREVYLLLFINLLFFSFTNIFLNSKNSLKQYLLNFSLIFLLCVTIINFHKSYLVFLILFIPIIFIILSYSFIPITYSKSFKFLMILFATTTVVFSHFSGVLEFIFDSIVNYQTGHFYYDNIYRADYVDRRNLVNMKYEFIFFFKYIFNNFFQYFLQPTLLNVSNFKDTVLLFENIIRLICMLIIFTKLFFVSNKKFFSFVCWDF